MSPSSTVHGGQHHDTKYVTFELLMHACGIRGWRNLGVYAWTSSYIANVRTIRRASTGEQHGAYSSPPASRVVAVKSTLHCTTLHYTRDSNTEQPPCNRPRQHANQGRFSSPSLSISGRLANEKIAEWRVYISRRHSRRYISKPNSLRCGCPLPPRLLCKESAPEMRPRICWGLERYSVWQSGISIHKYAINMSCETSTTLTLAARACGHCSPPQLCP